MNVRSSAMEISSSIVHMVATSSGIEGRASSFLSGKHSNLVRIASDEGMGVMSREAADALKTRVMPSMNIESL